MKKTTSHNSAIRRSLYTFLFIATVLTTALGFAPASTAGSLSTAVTGMFPKDIGEFAYADLKAARQFPWFSQLREQIRGMHGLG